VVGHLDPQFLDVMEDSKDLLRQVFQTQNRLTISVSGTGSAGMETCFTNLIEPGDQVVVCACGVFGQRMRDVAERCGAEVFPVAAEWGGPVAPDEVAETLQKIQGDVKLLAIVHAETSTGVLQPLEEIAALARGRGTLLVVDAVTSLAGIDIGVDALGIDACYSGTQKCLSCPPGLSPVTLNDRCLDLIRNRREKVQSWYLDLSMIEQYWGSDRVYHHTAPVSMNYALREALALVLEEGLEARWTRHAKNHQALVRGLTAMGLDLVVEEPFRLPMLTTVRIPDGVDDAAARRRLLEEFNIEIGGGLGDFKGKAWRLGLMGHTSSLENVFLFLAAAAAVLHGQGVAADAGEALEAALSPG
jgi:alanine-glyoxylate transaminase/serine-glyoxylate transaminase/serine-pyruvate transaminase